jgi:general secretion pathway protein D
LPPNFPRIMPNPLDNTLLIQATPQDYSAILRLLRTLDVPPRQVLIEAKIYELSLTGSLSAGLEAYLQARSCTGTGCASLPTNLLSGVINGNGLGLTIGTLVGQSRELLAVLNTGEVATRTKVISAPSVIATDSIPASINVGTEVPTLTGQAVTGFQSSGNSLFAQNIQNRNSGVTLNILARVNASGIITMVINQEVSAPQQPSSSSAIQSPSFSKRNVQTQVTVQDGDTVAIGGIIDEQQSFNSSGVPGLSRIPIIGWAFGSHTYGKSRTELIVFLTPRVIYDTAEITEATDELKSRMKHLSRSIEE